MASRKLNEAARQLVRERVIAGDANEQIRAALKTAQFPCDLTNATLSGYRADPEVQAALERRRAESMETGYADRGRRVEHLHRVAQALFVELFGKEDGTGFASQTAKERAATLEQWLACLREISRLDWINSPLSPQLKTTCRRLFVNNQLNLQGNPTCHAHPLFGETRWKPRKNSSNGILESLLETHDA